MNLATFAAPSLDLWTVAGAGTFTPEMIADKRANPGSSDNQMMPMRFFEGNCRAQMLSTSPVNSLVSSLLCRRQRPDLLSFGFAVVDSSLTV